MDIRAPPLTGEEAAGKKEAEPLWASTSSSGVMRKMGVITDSACPSKGWAVRSAYLKSPSSLSSDTFPVLSPLFRRTPIPLHAVPLHTESPTAPSGRAHRKGGAGHRYPTADIFQEWPDQEEGVEILFL